MTQLLVDIGNSFTKYAVANDRGLGTAVRRRNDPALMDHLLADLAERAPADAVRVATVGREAQLDTLRGVLAELGWPPPHCVRVRPGIAGLRLAYREPERLGVDRWLAMIGARARAGGSVIAVDAGTALTLDLVEASGEHRGGGIFPGLATMRGSLTAGAPHLESVEPSVDGVFPAADTPGGIAGGTLYGLVAAIDGLCGRLSALTADAPAIFLTGGDARRLQPLLVTPVTVAPDLVLEGLHTLGPEGMER